MANFAKNVTFCNGTYRIMLFSSKNIDIGPSYWLNWVRIPMFGLKFCGNFKANGTEIFYRSSEDYYLSIGYKNLSYDANSPFLIFWATFSRKMSFATTRSLNSLGPPNPTKKLGPTEWTFWANSYLKILFYKFSGVTPPPLNLNIMFLNCPQLLGATNPPLISP